MKKTMLFTVHQPVHVKALQIPLLRNLELKLLTYQTLMLM